MKVLKFGGSSVGTAASMHIENEELEELCKSIDEFYEMLRGRKTCMKVI